MADKYLLRVTAGPTYDPSTHTLVPVNTPAPTHITSPHCTASLSVRIQNYRGIPPPLSSSRNSTHPLPPGLPRHSPATSPYFTHPAHKHDQYSIAFIFTPHASLSGRALVFGNDFDTPVRDRLPPGTGTAMKIVKWAVDPGLEGDVYADRPWLYGRVGGSVNVLRVGEKGEGEEDGNGDGGVLEEGGDGEGVKVREEAGMPEGAKERRAWFLKEGGDSWVWEGGRVYRGDFFNGYLDFNGKARANGLVGAEFALKLPGFSLSILPYLGKTDSLRYVMKNKETGDVFFVVVFTLVQKEDVEKVEALAAKENKEKSLKEEEYEPSADDVD
ncbi:hypothetical protein MMC20_004624 [Loxospora ochrophaea]|nr:hypothetical protein [Loxospora ochrophaea]